MAFNSIEKLLNMFRLIQWYAKKDPFSMFQIEVDRKGKAHTVNNVSFTLSLSKSRIGKSKFGP